MLTILTCDFRQLRDWLDRHLNDAGREAFAFAKKNCLDPVLARYPNIEFYETFTDLTKEQALADKTNQRVQAALLLAAPRSNLPTMPIFAFHGNADTTVPFQDTIDYYNAECARNIGSLTRLDVQGTNHLQTAALIMGAQARQFLLDRLAGKPAPQGCSNSLFVPTAVPATRSMSTLPYDLHARALAAM